MNKCSLSVLPSEKISETRKFIKKYPGFCNRYIFMYSLFLVMVIINFIVFFPQFICTYQGFWQFVSNNMKKLFNKSNKDNIKNQVLGQNSLLIENQSVQENLSAQENLSVQDNLSNHQLIKPQIQKSVEKKENLISNWQKYMIFVYTLILLVVLIYGIIFLVSAIYNRIKSDEIDQNLSYLDFYIGMKPKEVLVPLRTVDNKWQNVCQTLTLEPNASPELVNEVLNSCIRGYKKYRSLCDAINLDDQSKKSYDIILHNLQNAKVICTNLSLQKLDADQILKIIYDKSNT